MIAPLMAYDWYKGMLVWDWFDVISGSEGGFVYFWFSSNAWTQTFPREVQS